MSYRPLISPLSASALVVALGLFGCSDSGGSAGNGGSTGQGQGGSGTTSGGKTGSGGSSSANGGSSSGGAASGGASSGGAQAQGGSSAGGSSSGGSTNAGGSSSGGKAASGGQASGGASTSGGSSSGGSSSGGRAATGGGPAGGATSGGAAGGPAGGNGSGGGGSVKVCDSATTLKAAAACNNKLIGAALANQELGNGSYSNAASEFNYATPENSMKWESIEPSQNNFSFRDGDAIVSFAQGKGMKIKGHTLVWHSQLASWVNNLSGPDVLKAMNNHITTVMNHYKGKLHAWDVVNEAWVTKNSNGSENKQGIGTASLRDSPFKKIGDDFIDQAFKTAKAADPNALLFYNDYSTEGMNDKSDAVYNMAKSMKERGIPIDGIGMQMHIGKPNDSPTAAEVKQNISRITALGLQVQISEMDINGCDGFDSAKMATLYHDIVAVCVADPLCTAVTVWGISDAGSWLNSFGEAGCNGRSANALLFDNNYGKKPTYNSVLQALIGK